METRKVMFLQQRRLIVLFLLTIVIPSVTLSVFGIQAIRNEKYRKEQENIAEQQIAMREFKTRFASQSDNIESTLLNIAKLSIFADRDYAGIKQTIEAQLMGNPLIGQGFVLFPEGYSFFPLLEPEPVRQEPYDPILTDSQQSYLSNAQEAEFVNRDYTRAISIYRELSGNVKGGNTKAQMLNHMARNQKKAGRNSSAIQTYRMIIEDYPSSLTSSGMPLALSAEMQIVDCYQQSGDSGRALRSALSLYENILDGFWLLNENKFRIYTEMAQGKVQELLKHNSPMTQEDSLRFMVLQDKHRLKYKQWKIRSQIENEIIPELRKYNVSPDSERIRFSKSFREQEFLITAVIIPGLTRDDKSGLLCIQWDTHEVINALFKTAAEHYDQNEGIRILLMNRSGHYLLGENKSLPDVIQVTGDFDHNFPPWKIQMFRTVPAAGFGATIYKSYYFWTIMTLLTILAFGAVLIIWTLAHEREVMAMKSDFVSSVSHELKTPLTSIKALTERLLDGKVKSPARMHQYFSVIAQDADKLTRLVKNILDFSKIEAGKKEYCFEKTDMTDWITETIRNFSKEYTHEKADIKFTADPDIPEMSIDRDELSQCINNLLDNALKFSTNSKRVEVHLKNKGDFVRIEVKDYGLGIDKKDRDHIFDKFYQGAQPIRQSVKGTGLGLTLVRHAVEAHEGRIHVESRPGNGSTFIISLPVKSH